MPTPPAPRFTAGECQRSPDLLVTDDIARLVAAIVANLNVGTDELAAIANRLLHERDQARDERDELLAVLRTISADRNLLQLDPFSRAELWRMLLKDRKVKRAALTTAR